MLLSAWTSGVFDKLASYLGIPANIIGIAVFLITAAIISIVLFSFTKNSLISALLTFPFMLYGAAIGYLPIWLVMVAGITILGWGVFMGGFGTIDNVFMWSRYGSRMKRAYLAKFGYENKEFNKEVDARILVMRTQGKGEFTQEIAQDWLKRMAQFVEIPFMSLESEGDREPENDSDNNDSCDEIECIDEPNEADNAA